MPDGDYTTPIGPARLAREGRDVSVYAYGMMAHYAEIAAEMVSRSDGIQAEVVDLRTLLPIDKEAILRSFQKTGKALIVHEDNLTLGYGAEVAAILSSDGFAYMDAPIMRLTGPDVPGVPFAHTMQEFFMPNPDKIAQAIRELAAY